MIGCTKLLCGTATVSEAVKYDRDSAKLPPHMLQFSADCRPLVVWNMTNRCNLKCRHCYLNAEEHAAENELSTAEAKVFIEDLAEMQVPVLLFSGGEPLVREDLFELAAYAKALAIRPVLSTNGTLITPEIAQKLKDAGFQYVGVSIDGTVETHDAFRGRHGAFAQTLQGIKNAQAAGLKTGMRFTVNKLNYKDLPAVLELAAREGIPRFCMYHLVYAGRGKDMAELDVTPAESREIIEMLIAKTLDFHRRGVEMEILTTDNHADGIYILRYLAQHQPERVDEVRELLRMHGGCSAGQKMANVNHMGNVHACQFWAHRPLGNVRDRKFSEIWTDKQDQFMCDLRVKTGKVEGKCGKCDYKEYCGGCRIRAEVVHGNIWGEDPACYLTVEEITKEV
jgi:radical SAM protein with 4Fe4S-binding SPASM domain